MRKIALIVLVLMVATACSPLRIVRHSVGSVIDTEEVSHYVCELPEAFTDASGVNWFVRLFAALVGEPCSNSREMRISCGANCLDEEMAMEALTLKSGEEFRAVTMVTRSAQASELEAVRSEAVEMIVQINGKK